MESIRYGIHSSCSYFVFLFYVRKRTTITKENEHDYPECLRPPAYDGATHDAIARQSMLRINASPIGRPALWPHQFLQNSGVGPDRQALSFL